MKRLLTVLVLFSTNAVYGQDLDRSKFNMLNVEATVNKSVDDLDKIVNDLSAVKKTLEVLQEEIKIAKVAKSVPKVNAQNEGWVCVGDKCYPISNLPVGTIYTDRDGRLRKKASSGQDWIQRVRNDTKTWYRNVDIQPTTMYNMPMTPASTIVYPQPIRSFVPIGSNMPVLQNCPTCFGNR